MYHHEILREQQTDHIQVNQGNVVATKEFHSEHYHVLIVYLVSYHISPVTELSERYHRVKKFSSVMIRIARFTSNVSVCGPQAEYLSYLSYAHASLWRGVILPDNITFELARQQLTQECD